MSTAVLLFLGTADDKAYLPKLKPLVGGAQVFVRTESISTITEVLLYCKPRGITGVISTNTTLLAKLLATQGNPRLAPKLSEYAGSYISYQGIEFVFIAPLEQLITVPYGSFLARRFISKLASPELWNEALAPAFNWRVLTPANIEEAHNVLANSFALATDIETYKVNLTIRCIGYSAVSLCRDGSIGIDSFVLPITDEFSLAWMRTLNLLPVPKIFQRGKYDISYLSRYNAVPHSYFWDTANLFHCWYSELPKDLAFLQSFCVRKAMYWKDLAETQDLQEYYRYNALDTWATACAWITLLLQMPQWAKDNYLLEFPLQFPCHLSEMTGMARDFDKLEIARTELDKILEAEKKSLDTMLGVTNFNVLSQPQMKAMLKILGCGDLESTDEKNLVKAAFRHPLNNRIITKIIGIPGSSEMDELGIRGLRKLKSTYLRTDADITKTSKKGAKELNERILYALNPDATDTSRLASQEHHFWCGLNIQNQPRGKIVKSTIKADDGFLFAEADLEQAESRDTAYISGDRALIEAVSGERDFHSVNTAAFFGVSYDSVYDTKNRRVLNKLLRDTAKRVNHGANYNMGASVLVDTMGLIRIYRAAQLLELPKLWTPIQIAEHLLQCFHRAYPGISGIYYPSVIHTIQTSRLLVGATGWTRYCFGNPEKNKRHLNAYVAHAPQSLNATVLNKAYMRVFYDIALHSQHAVNFKLCAQIHDSILFQFRLGHEYLMQMVKERMEIPVTVKGCDGVTRTFTVPAALKAGKDGKGAKYWSETE